MKLLEAPKMPNLLENWLTENSELVVNTISENPDNRDKFMTVCGHDLLFDFLTALQKANESIYQRMMVELKDSKSRNIFHFVSSFGEKSSEIIHILLTSMDYRSLSGILTKIFDYFC